MRVLGWVVGMLTPSLFALGCAAELAPGADGDGAEELAQVAPDSTQATPSVDMTGTWFTKVRTKANLRAPLVGEAPSDIDLALKLHVTSGGGQLSARVAVCNLATTSPTLTLNFDKVEPYIALDASIPTFAASVGGKVPLPEVLFHIGQDAQGTPVDVDKDGFPGGTVAAVALGLLPLNTYVALDLKIGMDATLTAADTVTGSATFAGNGKVLGSNFPLVTSGEITVKQTLTPTPFTAKRYAGDVPCAELLAKR